MSKSSDKKTHTPPTAEKLKQCRDQVELALSTSIKYLFDNGDDGGEFYTHVLMQCDRVIDDPRIPTAAVSVSSKITLYINSYFFVEVLAEGLNLKLESDRKKLHARRAAVLKHEMLHLIFHHCMRSKDFGNAMLSNIAADLVVNSNIDKNIMGEEFLYPEKFSLPRDQTLDWYYTNFPIEDNPICQDPSGHDKQYQQQGPSAGSQSGQGQKDKGAGKDKDKSKGGESQDKEQSQSNSSDSNHQHGNSHDQHDHAIDENGNCKVCGGVRTFDNHSVWSEDDGENISDSMKKSLVADAINRAADASKTIGRLPAAVQQQIALAKTKPQVPWQAILRQFVAKLSNSELHNTKKKISRRFKIRPGIRLKQKLKLQVAVDVSGSISDEEYKVFLNEIFAIAKNIGDVGVLEWDTQIQGHYKVKGYKPNLTRHGSGGTDPSEAIKWINDRKNSIDGCIFFTDGHLLQEDLKQKIRVPCLWVITADGSTEAIKGYRKLKLPKKAG